VDFAGHRWASLKALRQRISKMAKRDPARKKPVTIDKAQTQGGDTRGFSFTGQMPLLCLLLVITVFWTFFPAIHNDFVNYDDIAYITENSHVQTGLTWESIKWAFETSTASNWHPLTWLSLMVDCGLYGLHPQGHHLTNVLLHTANTLLLFLVLRRMTGAIWRSLWVAALFGLHPLHVESVAWAAERKDVLSTLFWLLTLWSYAKFAEGAKLRNGRAGYFYGLTLVLFTMGLMSKPMVVTLPFALLLLDYWPLARIPDYRLKMADIKPLLVEKIPFILLSAVASVITYSVQKSGGAMTTFDRLPFMLRAENTTVSYVRYLGKFFWPENLAVLYPMPREWPLWTVVSSGLVLLGITIMVLALRRSRSHLPVGWFWFIGTLVPVIGLVQVGGQSMADRYMYVPMIGVLIMIAWSVPEWFKPWQYGKVVVPVATTASAVLCLFITRQQIGYWKDSETLFQHDIAVAGDTPTAEYKLGVFLSNKGDLDGAARHFQENLKLRPDDYHALYALGIISGKKGQFEDAVLYYQAVVKLKPDYAEAHYNLGADLGKLGRLEMAINEYQEALRYNPDYFEAHLSLGVALARSGQFDEALKNFQAAHDLKPENIVALYNLGLAFHSTGQLDQSITTFQRIIELDPGNADVHNNLGLVLREKGQLDEAIGQFQEALRLNPNHVKARYNLDQTSQMKGTMPAPSTNQ
jgi:tetratricopeptide (TPR) repeat protein